MYSIYPFGFKVNGYEVLVLNEREGRAAAGILFLGAFFSFLQAVLLGRFNYLEWFITLFLADFLFGLWLHHNMHQASFLEE